MKDELRELVARLRETKQVPKVVSELEKRITRDTAKNGDVSSRQYVLHALQEGWEIGGLMVDLFSPHYRY